MTKKTIYNRLYREIDSYIKGLPENLKKSMGGIHFFFDFNSLVYKEGNAILAEYEPGLSSVTFYLDMIKNSKRTKKEDLQLLIKHELGHHFGLPEDKLPHFK